MDKHSKRAFDVGRALPPKRPEEPGKTATSKVVQAPRTKWSLKRIFAFIAVGLVGLLLFIGVWDAINFSRAANKTFGSGNVFALLSPGGLASQNGRTNILVAGYSADDAGHSGATLTDSIMLISLDSHTKNGYILSIPRDLYVNIPGFGSGKINEVYQDGGMDLLQHVVADDFGLPINYHVLVNYGAVRDTVNALGGVTISIKSSDPRGIYDPSLDYQSATCCALAKYPNGPAKLNGQQALDLTRARGDDPKSYGFAQADFDRTEHQRQIFEAIKDDISWTLVLNPLKNGKIFSAVGHNIQTDISLRAVRPLFGLFRRVPNSQLKSYSLRNLNGKNYLVSSAYEGSTLSPAAGTYNFSDIHAALSSLDQ